MGKMEQYELFLMLYDRCDSKSCEEADADRDKAFEVMNRHLKELGVVRELENDVNSAIAASDLVSFIRGYKLAMELMS